MEVTMRTGDTVFHAPSGETWIVAWADHETGYMAPCGWPTCQAQMRDCLIIRGATDDESKKLIDVLSRSGRTDAHKAGEIAARMRP
jgi:hypothetical protein